METGWSWYIPGSDGCFRWWFFRPNGKNGWSGGLARVAGWSDSIHLRECGWFFLFSCRWVPGFCRWSVSIVFQWLRWLRFPEVLRPGRFRVTGSYWVPGNPGKSEIYSSVKTNRYRQWNQTGWYRRYPLYGMPPFFRLSGQVQSGKYPSRVTAENQLGRRSVWLLVLLLFFVNFPSRLRFGDIRGGFPGMSGCIRPESIHFYRRRPNRN